MSFENFRKLVLKKMSESKQGSKSGIQQQPYQSTTSPLQPPFQSTTSPLKQGNSSPKGGCCGKRA
jgi:hypothetical protein